MGVQLNEVSLSYPGTGLVIDRLSASIEDGEFIAVLGASGCGKSTLLTLIAGLLALPRAGWTSRTTGRRSCSRIRTCCPG